MSSYKVRDRVSVVRRRQGKFDPSKYIFKTPACTLTWSSLQSSQGTRMSQTRFNHDGNGRIDSA